MNHIRKFLSYKNKKNPTQVVKESVLQVDDVYKVRVIVDVKKSMVNSYIKKVSDNTQKNLRDFYSDMDIVEELVKHVVESGMNVDTIPATILVGGSQNQPQAMPQAQAQTPQSAPQAQPEPPAQVSPQSQDDFEEVQPASQQQAQVQTEPVEEPKEEETTEEDEESPSDEEELPS